VKSSWTEENGEELLPLLRALSELFKAMLCKGINGLDRDEFYLPLKEQLEKLGKFKNPEISFLASYASQSLAYIGNDEPLGMTIFRYGTLALGIALNVKDIVLKSDPTGFISIYNNIMSMNDRIYKLEWYKLLMFVDCLLGREDFLNFEKFVLEKKSNERFMQGVCLRLEQIAETYRRDQRDAKVSDGAIKMLQGIATNHTDRVQGIAQISLHRISVGSEGKFYFYFSPSPNEKCIKYSNLILFLLNI
jgi:hypothetical protein